MVSAEPSAASGEIASHSHSKARVSTRGRSMERRSSASDGEGAVMPAFGTYVGGLSIRDAAFAALDIRYFPATSFLLRSNAIRPESFGAPITVADRR